MALNEPKMRSITGKLVANKLTERDDDFSFNVTYQANRSVKDLCKLAATNSKFTASELESAYNDLMAQAKIELYNASTVEFGFANNSLGVDGPFIGPDAKFDPSVNNVTLRCLPRIEFKEDLKNISVIVAGTEEGLPTITKVVDVATGSENLRITPGGGLNGEGNRVKITGSEGQTVGFFFVSDTDKTEIPVPVSALLRNDPSFFSFIIPQLNKGAYYLEVATQASTNSKKLLKEPRRNRFPYPLYVGNIPGEEERPGEL
mgnify:FL=1